MGTKQVTHILIVESDNVQADLIRQAFKDSDAHLTFTSNLADARASISNSSPNLIITELDLPDGKGGELIPTPDQKVKYPIVIMSSKGNAQSADSLIQRGALDYVIKSEHIFEHLPRIARQAIAHWDNIQQLQNIKTPLELPINETLASEKLAQIEQLTAGVGHEILNPINIISVRTQMLLQNRDQDQGIQDFYAKVMKEVKRIQKILKILKRFSQKNKSIHERIPLKLMISNVMAQIEPDATLKNINIVLDYHLETEKIYIHGNMQELHQVFLEFANNAIYAMPEGGTLTLRTTMANEGSFMQLSFSDTGTGISEENINRIFDPFFSTKSKDRGIGLGLSITHKLINDHGGKIHVKSEAGKGTTFTIDLPLA